MTKKSNKLHWDNYYESELVSIVSCCVCVCVQARMCALVCVCVCLPPGFRCCVQSWSCPVNTFPPRSEAVCTSVWVKRVLTYCDASPLLTNDAICSPNIAFAVRIKGIKCSLNMNTWDFPPSKNIVYIIIITAKLCICN